MIPKSLNSVLLSVGLVFLLAPFAEAQVYLQDGFASSAYAVGTDGTGKLHNKGASEACFAETWRSKDSSVVLCLNTGLTIPSSWNGFESLGAGSIGYKKTGASTNGTVGSSDSAYRAGYRKLTADALPTSGTFYFRALLQQQTGAGKSMEKEDMMRGIGLRTKTFPDIAGNDGPGHGRKESGDAMKDGVWFAFRKTASDKNAVKTELVFWLGGQRQTLVAEGDLTEDTTYLCLAEVKLSETGVSGRAFAMPSTSFDSRPNTHWGATIESTELTSSTPFAYLAMTGVHLTANAQVSFDEIAVASEVGELVPTAVTDFAVYPTTDALAPTLDGFIVPVTLEYAEGTADVVIEYGTSEESLTGSFAAVSGMSAGTETVTVTGLEPDMTYFWRVKATAGSRETVSAVKTMTTLGKPVLGAVSATLDGNAIVFAADLATPALAGDAEQPETSVTVTYTQGGETKTATLGTLTEAGAMSQRIEGFAWGVSCTYTVSASATKGGRTFGAASASVTLKVLMSGTMYVSATGSNTAPYATPETAAQAIKDAVAIGDTGAVILVAPGTYETVERIVLDRGVTVRGMTGKPADVVVKNVGTATAGRVFNLTSTQAVLADLTVADGHVVNYTGGNIWMTNGMVTNCVIQGATLKWSTNDANSEHGGAGVYMRAGKLVNCVIRNNTVAGTTAVKDQATGVYAKGTAVIQNCLFENNNSEYESAVVHLAENAHMINCTIVKSTLGTGTELNGGSASIRQQGEFAYVQNTVVVGIVDTEGKIVEPKRNTTTIYFANCAFDYDFPEIMITEKNCVRATTAAFSNYAGGNYRPAFGGPLVEAGKLDVANALPSLDLAGNPRLYKNTYDIGCYENQGGNFTISVR